MRGFNKPGRCLVSNMFVYPRGASFDAMSACHLFTLLSGKSFHIYLKSFVLLPALYGFHYKKRQIIKFF